MRQPTAIERWTKFNLFRRIGRENFLTEAMWRACIDMASPNLNMRDPVIYRICHASHQPGRYWCVNPVMILLAALAMPSAYFYSCHSGFATIGLYDWVLKTSTSITTANRVSRLGLNTP